VTYACSVLAEPLPFGRFQPTADLAVWTFRRVVTEHRLAVNAAHSQHFRARRYRSPTAPDAEASGDEGAFAHRENDL